MQLQPGEYYTVARGLENHLDTDTYYVRAVIRNARTDALIITLDLEDQGDGHRFSKEWQVPQDSSGLGFYILITTSVYTDSGYTTKSPNYADTYVEHLVQERYNPLLGAGGGGADVDYKRIEKIVDKRLQEHLAKLPEPEKLNVAFHLQPVLNALSGLRNDIQNLPEADFSGIEFRLNTLESAIRAIKIPKTDLSPVLEAINGLKNEIKPYTQKTSKEAESLLNRIKEFFAKDIDDINRKIESLVKELRSMIFVAVEPKYPVQPKETKEEINFAELLRK